LASRWWLPEVYDKKATDLSALVAKLKANKDIQAVVNWSIVPAQAIIAKNMRQAGWEVPLFQSHGFGNSNTWRPEDRPEGFIFPEAGLCWGQFLGTPKKALGGLKKGLRKGEKNPLLPLGQGLWGPHLARLGWGRPENRPWEIKSPGGD